MGFGTEDMETTTYDLWALKAVRSGRCLSTVSYRFF
jgi:hypothetical protein